MLGWKLFVRAVTMLSDNLPAALRVSLIPYAAVIAADTWLVATWPEAVGRVPTPETPVEPAFALAVMAALAVNLAVSLWVAVAWHRHTLRGEHAAGWLPAIHGRAMLSYLGRSMGIGLLVAAAFLLVGIVAAPFAPMVGVGLVSNVVPAVGFFIALILFYRLGLVLPAAALETPMRFGEAWRETSGQTRAVAVLALLTVGVALGLQVPTMLDAAAAARSEAGIGTGTEAAAGGTGLGGPITLVYQAVAGWIALMLGVSTLSALYAHVVEGRPVD